MTRKLQGALILVVVAALGATAAWAQNCDEKEENVWVAKDAMMAIHGHQEGMFISEDGEKFDLSDLADGETRTFGEGDKTITATRVGDTVTIDREGEGDERPLKIKCAVDTDTCEVMTFDGEPGKVMIMVKKTRDCVPGEDDCEAIVDVTLDDFELGEGTHAIIRKIHCNDEGDCEKFEDVHGVGEMEIHADVHHGGHGNVMIFKTDEVVGNQVMLRCPEGDSTVMIDKEEADETFLCPKHSVPMEKGAEKVFIKKIRLEEDD
jgi:hypothetical protein